MVSYNTDGKYSVNSNHLIRKRINELLADAIKKPIVTVCAGAGYGKTQAVLDFLEQQDVVFFWLQISERDNTTVHLWENIINSINHIDSAMAEQCREIGFPDTAEKMEKFVDLKNDTLNNLHITVWDGLN